MNNVFLTGNLTRDPDVRYTVSSDPMCRATFAIAVNDGYGEKQKTSYPNIVVFGRQAENVEKYLKKGHKVAIIGRIQTGSYEKDGHKVYTTDVVADKVEFLSSAD